MNILHIIFYTVKRYIIDVRYLMIMVAAPLLFILILGLSLDPIFGSINFEKTEVDVYSTEKQNFDDFNNFVRSQNFKTNICLKRISSKENGIQNVRSGSKAAFIVIETLPNNKKTISEYIYKKDNLECSIVENLVNSYNNKTAGSVKLSSIDSTAVYIKGKYPRSIDYYAVTMLVMMIWYASEVCVSLLDEDFCTDVKNRVKSLPVKKIEIIIGRILGCTFSIFIWAMSVVLITKFIFGVNWGRNYILIVCSILFISFLSANLGTSIFFILRNSDAAGYIIQVMVPVFTLLSGGYVPLSCLQEDLDKLSKLSPSFAVQNIIFNNIYTGYCENTGVYYSELAVILAVTCVTVTVLGRRVTK